MAAWRCDREGCGHVWYTGKEEAPERCAKCKARNWNTEGTNGKSEQVQSESKRSSARLPVQTARESIEQAISTGRRTTKHEAKVCRVYRCGTCAAEGVKDSNRGLK